MSRVQNPKTDRWVLATGRIGKTLGTQRQTAKQKPDSKESKRLSFDLDWEALGYKIDPRISKPHVKPAVSGEQKKKAAQKTQKTKITIDLPADQLDRLFADQNDYARSFVIPKKGLSTIEKRRLLQEYVTEFINTEDEPDEEAGEPEEDERKQNVLDCLEGVIDAAEFVDNILCDEFMEASSLFWFETKAVKVYIDCRFIRFNYIFMFIFVPF